MLVMAILHPRHRLNSTQLNSTVELNRIVGVNAPLVGLLFSCFIFSLSARRRQKLDLHLV